MEGGQVLKKERSPGFHTYKKRGDKIVFLYKCKVKGMEHVPNIFMSFDKYLFLEVINILIYIGLFKQYEI